MPPSLFEACEPHEDVLEGRLQEDQFAASVSGVAHDPETAPAVYSDPAEFFAKTYPTEGLQELLEMVVKAVLAAEGEDVDEDFSRMVGLDTTFGGGKTHDLIATYHLLEHRDAIGNLADFIDGSLAERFIQVDRPFRTAVIDGEAISATEARATDAADHPPTQTLWGELVYQLLGLEAYRRIESYDQDRNVPAGDLLADLFRDSDAYHLILMDELALYLEDAAAVTVGDSTLADQTTTFMFRLLRAISSVDNVTLVYSISESAYADRAEELRGAVEQAEDDLGEIFARKHRVLTPTGDTEVGSVLRRRLFAAIDADAAAEVAAAYAAYYGSHPRELPAAARDPGYRAQIEREYPFHPSLLDTLTKKVDSIPRFQKTRGALKLLAAAVRHLWEHRPEAYTRHMLRTYDLSLAQPLIRTEVTELGEITEELEAAIRSDVYNDDENSFAQQEDVRWADDGFPAYGSHLAVTILWNSVAAGDNAKGMTRNQLYLQVSHPDLQTDHYDTALGNLTYKSDISYACHYLYDEDRLQFRGYVNLTRTIQEVSESVSDAEATSEVERNIREAVRDGPFETVIFPTHISEVPDDKERPNLVVMGADRAEVRGPDPAAPAFIEEIFAETAVDYDGRVDKRVYKNNLVFLVPNADEVATAIAKARLYLAQKQVRDDPDKMDQLNEVQVSKLEELIARSKNLMQEKSKTAYRHLYVPDADGELEHQTVTTVGANGRGGLQTSVLETLEEFERVIRGTDAPKAWIWIDKKLWRRDSERMSLAAMVEQFGRRPGLPILLDVGQVVAMVRRVIGDDPDGITPAYVDEEGPTMCAPLSVVGARFDNAEYDLGSWDGVTTDAGAANIRISEETYLYVDADTAWSTFDFGRPQKFEPGSDDGGRGSGGGSGSGGGTVSLKPVRKGPGTASTVLAEAVGELASAAEAWKQFTLELKGQSRFEHLQFLLENTSLRQLPISIKFSFNARQEGDRVHLEGDQALLETVGYDLFNRFDDSWETDTTVSLTVSPDTPESLGEDGVLAEVTEELEGTAVEAMVLLDPAVPTSAPAGGE